VVSDEPFVGLGFLVPMARLWRCLLPNGVEPQ